MRKLPLFLLLLASSCGTSELWHEPVECRLTGSISGMPPEQSLWIALPDSYDIGTPIPVADGRYAYTLRTDTLRAYELRIGTRSSYTPLDFFPENGTVTIDLAWDETGKFIPSPIGGAGKPNRTINDFKKEKDAKFGRLYDEIYAKLNGLQRERRFDSPAVDSLYRLLEGRLSHEERNGIYRRIDELRLSGEAYTPEARELLAGKDSLDDRSREWTRDYVAAHPSLGGFFCLVQNLRYDRLQHKPLTAWLELYDRIFAGRFAGHPYHAVTEDFRSSEQVRVGGRYIDATLPDAEGNHVRLSTLVEGKVTLLDMWASWCGPCRAYSRQIAPVYEKYRERGFVVVGIAREFHDLTDWHAALTQEGHPWPELVELDDANGLWTKYGIPNAAGSSFLIDRDGTVLAVYPSPEELDRLLKEKLG